MSLTREERRSFTRSGIPVEAPAGMPLPKRVMRRPLVWLGVALLLTYAVLLILLYNQFVPDREVPGGRLVGLGTEAIPIAAKYAAITVIPLSLLFVWADRFRPQRFWIWLITFGWGACVATYVSAQINTWAAGHLSVIGDGDPASSARAAIYVAPFVEEASKATVLFWLAILMRYQWVSRLSGVALAGISGAAFAFVENIIYYGRAYRYAARTFGEVTPLEALQSLFVQRGILTFFGHPLFTSMTGIGLAVALRSKSKIVRVVAPLVGFCAAAFLHMAFNTTVSMVGGTQLLLIYLFVALPLVGALVAFIVRQLFREGRLIRERLTDYVRTGWIADDLPAPVSRLRTRLRALWQALWQGPDTFVATIRLQRALTELAYLRDAMSRGLVDQAGLAREKILLARIREVRPAAIVVPGPRAAYPSLRRRRRAAVGYAPAAHPGPAGLGGNFPAPVAVGAGQVGAGQVSAGQVGAGPVGAGPVGNFPAPEAYPPPPPGAYPAPAPGAPPVGSAPLGQTAIQHSEVDPTWKPPPG